MRKNNPYISALSALFIIGLAILICTGAALADDLENDYSMQDILGTNYVKMGHGSNLLQFKQIFSVSASRSAKIDYSKDLWMPVQEWEYEVCSRGLSTQLRSDDGAGVMSSGELSTSGIYDDAATVAAYKWISSNDSQAPNSSLYEITWYFHPKGNDKTYNIDMVGPNGTKTILSKKSASTRTGNSGYEAFYSNDTYTSVVMTYESQEHKYPIIIKEDKNR